MDGSPQVVRFDATTLWHLDAAEWAPSTNSFGHHREDTAAYVRFAPKADKWEDESLSLLCADIVAKVFLHC